MTEFKGTKGDWKVKSKISGLETEIFCGKIRVAQAKHFNDGKEGKENYFKNDPLEKEGFANAKLIAAAPELLKALQGLIKEVKTLELSHGSDVEEYLEDELKQSYKAVNKALN